MAPTLQIPCSRRIHIYTHAHLHASSRRLARFAMPGAFRTLQLKSRNVKEYTLNDLCERVKSPMLTMTRCCQPGSATGVLPEERRQYRHVRPVEKIVQENQRFHLCRLYTHFSFFRRCFLVENTVQCCCHRNRPNSSQLFFLFSRIYFTW